MVGVSKATGPENIQGKLFCRHRGGLLSYCLGKITVSAGCGGSNGGDFLQNKSTLALQRMEKSSRLDGERNGPERNEPGGAAEQRVKLINFKENY